VTKRPGEGTAAAGASPPLSTLLDAVADAVQAVRAGRSLNDLLPAVPAALRPGTQALAFHALRWLGSAQAVRARLAPKPPPPAVDALLVTALALLWPEGPPPYAEFTLVDQTVKAARRRAPASVGFVNAVLRRFLRERSTLIAALQAQGASEAVWNHPAWWVEEVQRDWPDVWQGLLRAANRKPPMTLRVNVRRGPGAAYLRRLQGAGLAATLLDGPEYGGEASATVVLAQPVPVQALPGFADGDVSVQDAAAQRAARLLLAGGLPPGARVLDACAAPGGKTAHLLELATLDLLALDSDAARLARVQQNIDRLQLAGAGSRIELRAADARRTAEWWDGRPFDAILLDAPCTASGIVRRHPDVRWLRRPGDIATLARTQAELLDALWPLLAPGGVLLYATCSVFKAEGRHAIDAFLQRPGAEQATLDGASPGHLHPLADNPETLDERPALQDGFFYARLLKR
jgi:16S rRNA (cytosine967-C5)-methyltransferase